jgi:hypothetical protein
MSVSCQIALRKEKVEKVSIALGFRAKNKNGETQTYEMKPQFHHGSKKAIFCCLSR